MARLLQFTLTGIFLTIISFNSFNQKLGFKEVLENNPTRITTFCIPNSDQSRLTLEKNSINIKYETKDLLFISVTPLWISNAKKNKAIEDFYFENAPPALMSDSARAFHFVNEVHSGSGGLNSSYTGKNVIIGIVDTGVDYEHPDFQDSLGNTRILRYWDQTMPDDVNSPQPYGYGYIWDSVQINNGSITSISNLDNSNHGTTVAGQAAGNGRANGQNKGMAPDANIIAIESDFTRSNWTLTVADACDYVFKVADSLGMPAVVNLSLGTYFGSHDAKDPAGVAIDALLDEKPGRIVVGAAGNSGNIGKYHQHDDPGVDTNFVWLKNNPSGGYGANTIYIELWSDLAEASFDFAIGANSLSPDWSDRGRTNFYNASAILGPVVMDTIWNAGNRIATVELYTGLQNGNYRLQVLVRVDSTSYNYRFETTGSGSYDLWSGLGLGFNEIVEYAPSLSEFPDSIYYRSPDLEQTIVSSWNCSEKVLSVANMRNRASYIDYNLNAYTSADNTPPGKLSPNSSKGPNRNNFIKPDITAAGDLSLGSVTSWYINYAANFGVIDSSGWHARNGGTSMASPVVAGIAALYLERCNKATYQNFIDDLKSSAYTDGFTGTVPNNSYGYGKAHALNALLLEDIPLVPAITEDWQNTTLTSSQPNGNQWYLNDTILIGAINQDYIATPPFGSYHVLYTNADGCSSFSLPIVISAGIEELGYNMVNTYPNPSQSEITIDFDKEISEVSVISSDGKITYLKSLGLKSYSIENLKKGNYILKIKTKEGIYSSKIVRI